MKKFAAALFVLVPLLAWSQDNNITFNIHEDRVNPSMIAEYEAAANRLLATLKENDIEGPSWLAASTEDSRYLYVAKINNMADLDNNMFAPLVEKIGAEATAKLFDDMDKCYQQHGNYLLHLDSDLSYMPEGLNQNPEGQPYRRFIYLYSSPANWDKLVENVKAHKTLSESKESKWHYRVYRSGFGSMNNYIMVAIAAKDAVDFETRRQEMLDLLGSERQALMHETWKNVLKFETVIGRIREDLSYGL